jgi:hypothetical protein
MTPIEKAKELLEKMSYNDFDANHNCSYYVAKNCALIAVEEILNTLYSIPFGNALDNELEYWEEVKQEIEKL